MQIYAHPLSEERKVKSEENRCPFGTFLIIFVRKYHFFSLFILLSSLGCCILQQPHNRIVYFAFIYRRTPAYTT